MSLLKALWFRDALEGASERGFGLGPATVSLTNAADPAHSIALGTYEPASNGLGPKQWSAEP